MGRSGEEEKKRKGASTEREQERKTSGLYSEKPLGQGKPSFWAGNFKVRGKVCQVGTEDAGRIWRPSLLCKYLKM